ncbi:hypothetical protein Ocin01_02144 [Orchesella cincta]|uniref:Uncharacterized protein n=1 Tax=Orchesella cincta TaxID=48709 RepID=A0A1D2NH24_ORCCI|nr:hypothetical protein Ocin01_02144 [Orchesella cincta]
MLSISILWFLTLTLTMASARSHHPEILSKNETTLSGTSRPIENNWLIGDEVFPESVSIRPPPQPVIQKVHENSVDVDPENRTTWFWLTGTDNQKADDQSLQSIWELSKNVYKIFKESVKAHPQTAHNLTSLIGNSSEGISILIENINNSKLTLDKLRHSLNMSSQRAELSIWLLFICVLVYAEALQ